MPRPFKVRRVACCPEANYYKPRGIPVAELEEIILSTDELEAIRLADLNGHYQEKAAGNMNISRQTFGNIIRSAHKKIADALVNGKALKIEGGAVAVEQRQFGCHECSHQWILPFGTGRPMSCPQCRSNNIFRVLRDRKSEPRSGVAVKKRRCVPVTD